MPLHRTIGGNLQAFDLNEARENKETCDVFVSHKKDDENLAMEVYDCIKTYELVPWIDLKDPNIAGDSPTLDEHIQSVISSSFSLIVVASDLTHQSWWVPFEIGIAFDQSCLLGTFVKQREEVELPSFLDKHPLMRKHEPDLHQWCRDVRVAKLLASMSPDTLFEDSSEGRAMRMSRSSYVSEMRRMARQYR